MSIIRQRLSLLIMLALASSPALALRCGYELVLEGDHKIEVRAACGEPGDVTQLSGYRYRNQFYNQLNRDWRFYSKVEVELWTYNFGPRNFMRRLRFENGTLVDVETLSRGFRER